MHSNFVISSMMTSSFAGAVGGIGAAMTKFASARVVARISSLKCIVANCSIFVCVEDQTFHSSMEYTSKQKGKHNRRTAGT